MIEFKEGTVCFAGGKCWYAIDDSYKRLVDDSAVSVDIETLMKSPDFQLNTIKQGDYIEVSELDTEQKYNNAVDVFKLFWFDVLYTYDEFSYDTRKYSRLIVIDGEVGTCSNTYSGVKRKLTYPQIMAIGELKRLKLLEIGRQFLFSIPPDHFLPKAGKYAVSDKELERSAPKIAPDLTPDNQRRNKSKQAYDILNSLDYEYDLVKQQWYRKEWV